MIPEISCVMAVHHDEGYLSAAIQSVLDQVGISFELIIVANNCTDQLWNYLESLRDERIRIFRTKIGQLVYNLNFGIEQARGSLIARMDADDICEPNRFLMQWQAFQARPELSVLGSAYQEIDEFGRVTGTFSPATENEKIRSQMSLKCPLAHPTVMFRKKVFLDFRGYAFGFFGEDYDLWLRMRRNPSVVFANLSEPLLKYRKHSGQMSSASKSRETFYCLLPLYLREFALTGEILFLVGALNRWFFSTWTWRTVRPLVNWVREKKYI